MAKLTLYGVELSPYVRKVRLALAFKGLDYQQIPVFPFMEDKPVEFVDNSPLGKIPLFASDDNFITDSAVIIAYLERAYPQPALLPSDDIAAARALWFAEYASSKMVEVIGGHLFAEVILAKQFFNREPIQTDIDKAITTEIPEICTYLENELSSNFLVGDSFTLADLCVGAMFLMMHHCQQRCDASKWPKVAAYIERVHGSKLFCDLQVEEKQLFAKYGMTA
ncbi:glutathione S-transferase family protein [Thalassotalea sp. ND16A]|uniref:glutathione S-transferase family protein n=1 Tax=Thalassotalea sp. ND16A TaxID=1535422 RepID=UPI00051CFE6F|nr:glutathione S-transferase family protein [Thalassotalea sp. ND16A]KGK00486.1 hypothetical protein ND16A_3454 [Thalassotalea sp. ND16A]